MSETDTQPEAPALPGDGLREGIVDALRADLGDRLIDTHLQPQDDLWVRVAADAWAFTARSLKAQGFDYFCYLSAMDWMPSPYGKGEDNPDDEPSERNTEIRQGYAGGESRFQLIARLTDTRRHVGLTVKADVPDSMVMPTWIASFAGANWHERETHEMFGIGFDGHPDLRNLYLPGEFEGFPLRKDFPLLSRMVKPWPGIVDVEPMPDFGEPDGGDAPKSDDTAAGDAVESATDSPGEAEAGDVVAEAEATPDAVEPDGEPATGPVADTIISDDTPSGEASAADDTTDPEPDDLGPGADGTVEADLEPGTATMSTDADAEAPTPGPATPEHPDGLTGGVDPAGTDDADDAEDGDVDRNVDRNDEESTS